MQAIIMASGVGSRMMPLTKNTPKPLLKIAGKPMMEYVIDLLVSHGVREIGVSLFYLGDQIEKYFDDGSRYGVTIKYAREKELTGTAGAVKAVAKVLSPTQPFFAISSDMLVNFDLTSIYKFHKEHSEIATLACYWRPIEKILNKSGLIVFDEKTKLITNFVERPQTPEETLSQWVNSSVYLFDPRIIDFIPDIIDGSPVIDFPQHVFPKLLEAHKKMYAYQVNDTKFYQLGIDTPDRIQKAEEDIQKGLFNQSA